MVTRYQLHCLLCCVNVINLIGSTITRETNLWAFLRGHFYIGLIDEERVQPNSGWYRPTGWSPGLQNEEKLSCAAASLRACSRCVPCGRPPPASAPRQDVFLTCAPKSRLPSFSCLSQVFCWFVAALSVPRLLSQNVTKKAGSMTH